MSRLEKKFILSQTIDLSNVTDAQKSTEVETHFSIPWCLVYLKSNDRFTLCVFCLYSKSDEWEIETKLKFKLKSANGTYLKLSNERNFGNVKENSGLSWAWTEFIKLKDIENHYAVNGKFEIEAQCIIKKMSGFGIEKLKYFDNSSKNRWDVIISVDGHKFYLSKTFLAFQSTYFDNLLFGSFKEISQTEVELKEVDHEDFQSFLELIHGESAVNDTNIDGVLHLADMFDAPTAVRRCEEFLLEKSKWSLDERVKLAKRYNLKDSMVILRQSSDLC